MLDLLSPSAYWFFSGLFYLIWLTWQDLRNNRLVDDRKNWFMMGVTYSLLSHIRVNFIYLIGIFVITILLYVFMHKLKPIGRADANTITWIFVGLCILGVPLLIFYTVAFSAATLFVLLLKKYIFRYEPPIPFYPVFLSTFVLTAFFFGLF